MSRKPGGGWSAASRAGGQPPVAKQPHHPKGAAPSRAYLQHEINVLRHHLAQGTGKHHHHAAAKHHPHKGGKKHQRKRGLALGGMVACCAAEAVAASLRLAGHPVSDYDVLALYWATAQDADAGASIEETLWATTEHGLAGCAPESWRQILGERDEAGGAPQYSLCGARCDEGAARGDAPFPVAHGLILGVDLPGPHTVTVDADGQWLTWGETLPPFPGAVIEEAWQVIW